VTLADQAVATLAAERIEQLRLRYRALCARLDGFGDLDKEIEGFARGLADDRAAHDRALPIVQKEFAA